MCTSLVIWYIVNGHAVGAIVFTWFFTFIEMYFVLKYPRFTPGVTVMIVTQLLIIGYELQVAKIGKAAAERAGQPYYP